MLRGNRLGRGDATFGEVTLIFPTSNVLNILLNTGIIDMRSKVSRSLDLEGDYYSLKPPILKNFIYFLIYLWLHWVFVVANGLFSSRGEQVLFSS